MPRHGMILLYVAWPASELLLNVCAVHMQDRSTLTSSAEHWEKAQAATEEARRQVSTIF